MTKSTWYSGRGCVLDSGFGYARTVIKLKKKGVFSATLIKKKICWPKHEKAQEMMNVMQGKEVITTKVHPLMVLMLMI